MMADGIQWLTSASCRDLESKLEVVAWTAWLASSSNWNLKSQTDKRTLFLKYGIKISRQPYMYVVPEVGWNDTGSRLERMSCDVSCNSST